MNLLSRALAALIPKRVPTGLSSVDSRGGWFSGSSIFPWIREPYPGAWQRNDEWTVDTVLAHHAVYACITLIANDIGKLRHKLVEEDSDGIWSETTSAAFSPVLRRPNRYQNHIQFKQWWMTSKLIRGNAIGLKQRDNRGIVVALYVLDWSRVTVLVAPDGSVYYQLSSDNLAGLQNDSVTVPASEIIHDRMNCLFHPLIGVSPLFASGAAANIGLRIQTDSSNFFANGSNPGGILMVPGAIPQEKANELKTAWDANYGGDSSGKIAVLADGMKFQPMRMSAVESQLIEQMRWTAEVICSTFHVPPYKIGVGEEPAAANVEARQVDYYTTCLQSLIEEYEACMDEGLGIETKIEGRQLGVELDLDGLLRMDKQTQIQTLAEGVKGSLLRVNEGRKRLDLKPVTGGDMIWMQQQNYSLEALAKRDSKEDPFATQSNAPPVQPQLALPAPEEDDAEDEAKSLCDLLIAKFSGELNTAQIGAIE